MYENYGWKYVVTALITALFTAALYMNGLKPGLDLSGGVELLYRLDLSRLHSANQDTIGQTVEILQRRLDELAIKELSIRPQGTEYIVIQVPGGTATDTQNIRSTLERAGKLDFKLVVSEKQGLSERMIEDEIRRIKSAKEAGTFREDQDRYDIAVDKEPRGASLKVDGVWYVLLESKGTSGSLLTDAYRAPDGLGRPAVGFEFGRTGQKVFYEMTSSNIGRLMAIVLDGNAQSAPEIKAAIGDRGIIEGGAQGFTEDYIKSLIAVLKSGPLPVKPEFQYEQKVGASLGLYAIKMGIVATVASMALVLFFMVFYYKVGGLISDVALALNILLLLGVLAAFEATLTLPGIAGILLTAGMAVDANILIFERMREEHERGANIKQAIQLGYDRAFWTIFDSHVTTLVTGFVLYKVGTGPIRGFAVTLIIGVSISLFTALLVTKMIYGWLGAKEHLPHINFMKLFSKPNFDFMGAYRKAVVASLLLINIGFLVFLLRGTDKYGIDFTGGTVVQMRVKSPIEKTEVEKRVKKFSKDFEVQRVGSRAEGGTDRGLEFQIRTRSMGVEKPGEKKSASANGLEIIRTASGQDGVPKKQESPTPTPTPPSPTPNASPTPSTTPNATPSASPTPSTSPRGPGLEPERQESPPPQEQPVTEEKSVAAADLFATKLQEEFKDVLVDGYPANDKGQLYATEPAGTDKVKIRMRVNLLAAARATGGTSEATAAALQEKLPALFREIAAGITKPGMSEQSRKTALNELALGVEAKEIAAGEGGLKTFELTSSPVSAGLVSQAYDGMRSGLERSKDWLVADPFPRRDQIGAAVATNLKSKAYISMFLAVIAIVIYVAFRFELIWGIGAIIALAHDVMTTIGFLSIVDFTCAKLGIDFDAKINLPTVAAFLTLIGYSIADTIVVYDRIREAIRLKKMTAPDAAVINDAVNGTLSRTILTSLTVFLVALVLFICSFFGLKVIQGFSAAMCFGVITGTYSSVFIAAPVIIAPPKQTAKLLGIELAGLVAAGIVVMALHLAS